MPFTHVSAVSLSQKLSVELCTAIGGDRILSAFIGGIATLLNLRRQIAHTRPYAELQKIVAAKPYKIAHTMSWHAADNRLLENRRVSRR